MVGALLRLLTFCFFQRFHRIEVQFQSLDQLRKALLTPRFGLHVHAETCIGALHGGRHGEEVPVGTLMGFQPFDQRINVGFCNDKAFRLKN